MIKGAPSRAQIGHAADQSIGCIWIYGFSSDLCVKRLQPEVSAGMGPVHLEAIGVEKAVQIISQ